jgi:hypothetical protein
MTRIYKALGMAFAGCTGPSAPLSVHFGRGPSAQKVETIHSYDAGVSASAPTIRYGVSA